MAPVRDELCDSLYAPSIILDRVGIWVFPRSFFPFSTGKNYVTGGGHVWTATNSTDHRGGYNIPSKQKRVNYATNRASLLERADLAHTAQDGFPPCLYPSATLS